jgi:hypothetical protein
MKKKLNAEQIIWICGAVFLIFALVLGIANRAAEKNSGIDIYVSGWKLFGSNPHDYMRIQSEKKSYPADEEIVLNASCGFYDSPYGKGASRLYFHVACNAYVDVSISVGTLGEYTDEDFYETAYGYISSGPDNFYYYETENFDSTLFIMKRGFLGQINKNSLQYPFTVTLKAKPDAPESFTGTVYIQVSDNREGRSYISVNFQKEGDTITLLPN